MSHVSFFMRFLKMDQENNDNNKKKVTKNEKGIGYSWRT